MGGGGDDDTATETVSLSLSSSSSGSMRMLFSDNYSDDEYECSNDIDGRRAKWNDAIDIARSNTPINHDDNKINIHRTSIRISPSPSTNADNGNNSNDIDIDNDNYNYNYNDDYNDNNKSQNDESFSSFLSSSLGDNISKSFDWALETTTMQSCQNPFECYCLPINLQATRYQTASNRQQREKTEEDDDDDEVSRTPIPDDDDDDTEEEEDHRPYVPFRLPPSCEYCGCPSVRRCREFDPTCRRPESFFPKANPPFGARQEVL